MDGGDAHMGGGDASAEAAGDADAGGDGVAADAGAGGDAQPTDAGGDGAGSDAPADGPKFTMSFLRVANWSPDAPAVDFCIAPHGTASFRGPIAHALAVSRDASATPLTFPLVSAYEPVDPGAYDVRIVAYGAPNCSVGIRQDTQTLPALAAGAFGTIALVGELQPAGSDQPIEVVAFKDTTTAGSGISVRFINASPAFGSLDVGKGTMLGFQPFFKGIAFGTASTPQELPMASAPDASTPAVDGNGYMAISKLSNTTLSARDPTQGTDAVTASVTAAGGSVLTMVFVGGTLATMPPSPPGLLECVDNAGRVGELSSCTCVTAPSPACPLTQFTQ
jgi:hypothetical protein